ncbi:MAG: prephenate dehydratase domain-containing protein [Bacteroidota bacterium]
MQQSVLTSTPNIAIQGERGSFHEIAARKFLGNEIELTMCDSFPALFRSLDNGVAEIGVMAIENTVAGTLLPNYALLRNSNYRVIGEVYLRIAHQLMALPGQRIEDIREVHSHPMAIRQCHRFFSQYPHIRLIEKADTAGSAAWIQEQQAKGIAAIASELAAETYELPILAHNVEDNPRNFTRFLIILDKEVAPEKPGPANKASVCFNLAHQVGSLSQILLVLSAHGMNLTKIQSLPIVGQEWEYFFHIDLEFDDHAQYERALSAIQHQVNELKVLGEYPRGDKQNVA